MKIPRKDKTDMKNRNSFFQWISKTKFLARGLLLVTRFKVVSSGDSTFDGYLVDRVENKKLKRDLLFAIKLFTAERDLENLSKVATHAERVQSSLSKKEWMALIESLIWEKKASATRFIENSSLDAESKDWYLRMARFYSGSLSTKELAASVNDINRTSWSWFLSKFFMIYALCESGSVKRGEELLRDVIRRDPGVFIEFQERFEHTGFQKYHISNEFDQNEV